MKEKDDTFNIDASHLDNYRKAQDIEKKSEDFYRTKAKVAKSDEQKSVLLKIADEENKHFHLLDNIIDFVQRPKRWLENAEWNNLEEY